MARLSLALSGIVVSVMVAANSASLLAQTFRVETKLFLNDERVGAHETLTLFDNGRIYDFIFDDSQRIREVTVYDVKNARFLLIDTRRELQSEVTSAELAQFSAALKERAESENKSAREIILPAFEEQFDEVSGKLVLDSPRIMYEVQCKKANVDEARQYNQFADWYARLNATQPGNPPPFARLDLNEALAQRDLIPESVQRTYKPLNRVFGRPQVVRSEHLFSWRLLETDRNRMAEAQRYQAKFKQVDFATYRDLESLAKND